MWSWSWSSPFVASAVVFMVMPVVLVTVVVVVVVLVVVVVVVVLLMFVVVVLGSCFPRLRRARCHGFVVVAVLGVMGFVVCIVGWWLCWWATAVAVVVATAG